MVYATSEPDRALIGERSDAIMADIADEGGEDMADDTSPTVPGLLDDPNAPFSGAGLFGLSPEQSLEALSKQVRQFARDTPDRVGYVPLAFLQRDMSTGPALLQHLVGAAGPGGGEVEPPLSPRQPAATQGWARTGPPTRATSPVSALRTDDFLRHVQRSPGGGSPGGVTRGHPACHAVSTQDWTVLITAHDVVTVTSAGVQSSIPMALIKARGGDVQLLPQASTPVSSPAHSTPADTLTTGAPPKTTLAESKHGNDISQFSAPPRGRLALKIKSITHLQQPHQHRVDASPQPAANPTHTPQDAGSSSASASTPSMRDEGGASKHLPPSTAEHPPPTSGQYS